LLIPQAHSSKGPGKRLGCVFFNAQMAFNRDVSVMLFRSLRVKGTALDAMAATGARGIRLANESPGDFRMFVNDKDPRAFRYIQANIGLNALENCEAVNQDLRCHLASAVHDYVDIDPFGTPAPFVQAALQGLKRNGVLAVTATDTAPLAGTHAKKCARRYMARPLRNAFGHETGLRILLGYLAREAAQLDKGVRPLLCFYADHYFRCFVRAPESAAAADAMAALRAIARIVSRIRLCRIRSSMKHGPSRHCERSDAIHAAKLRRLRIASSPRVRPGVVRRNDGFSIASPACWRSCRTSGRPPGSPWSSFRRRVGRRSDW